jgi:hypothetical protein
LAASAAGLTIRDLTPDTEHVQGPVLRLGWGAGRRLD